MNWSDEWKKLVQNSTFKKGNNTSFTSKEFTDWYEIQIKHNNYPADILDKIQSFIDKDSTILDMGAGTGAFTVPLSKNVKEITALEPSNEMLSHLKNKMSEAGINNIKIINKRIEDVSIKDMRRYDIVLAAYSLYDIKDIKAELKKMLSISENRLFIVIGFGRSQFYNDIWQYFKGEYNPLPSFIHLYNILYEMGIPANVEIMKSMGTQVFINMDQAINHWMRYLKLPHEKRDKLRKYLSNYVIEKDGKIHLEMEKQVAVIICDKKLCNNKC